MNHLKYRPSYRRNLPHIQPPGATFFITFRLAGSLPSDVQERLLEERKQELQSLAQIEDGAERERQMDLARRRYFGRWDNALDAAFSSPFWLGQRAVAQEVSNSLHHRHGRVYGLDAFCIMPNHVHTIFTLGTASDDQYHCLPAIMQSLKGFTARKANALLDRQGAFWQAESYDHVIRDADEWHRIRRYIALNPVKAGLVEKWRDWPWTFVRDYGDGVGEEPPFW